MALPHPPHLGANTSKKSALEQKFRIITSLVQNTNKLCLWNTNAPESRHFLKSVAMVFDLDLGKLPRPWYHQMCNDEMSLHTKYEPCN